ncbi:hypothetical protein DSO57_1036583 [Entomophthora muscae]|uniref:Uncharacterized protein n=1 Tax=Entomophthora muscae TaxID=34485 RepID=A0ACC2TA16_9FUNG|nr:hypothetical protein DSO57_1036583 [Entomophthora muscae]
MKSSAVIFLSATTSDNFPGRTHEILFTGESLVKSLTYNDMEFALSELVYVDFITEEIPTINCFEEKSLPSHQNLPMISEKSSKCNPWILSGMLLMALNV